MSDKFYVGLDITGFENTGKYRPISRVTLIIDDSASVTAGDDSGIEISAQCPHATQAMANALLAQMKGYQYQAFTADAANLDPAAELGDGITANGVYSTLSRIDDDGRGFPNISAPGEVAMEEEYPSAGPMTQEFNRQISETRSQITKTAEEIRLEVSNEIEGLSASISVRLDSITSTVQGQGQAISVVEQRLDSITSTVQGQGQAISVVEQRVDSITSTVQGQGQAISVVEQRVDSIRLSVSNGSTSSYISLSIDGVVVASQNIYMSGLVTYTGLAGGTTTIDGACIKTGTIDANRLNLSGAITFSDLSSDVRNDINTVSRWTYSGTTYIDGAQIMTGTVSASTLEGGSVNLLNYAGGTVGILTMTGASSSSYAIDLRSFGALRLTGQSGDVFIQSGVGINPYLHIASDLIVGYADLRSNQSGSYSCGTSIYRWSEVYSSTSEITTSDRNLKNTISYDLTAYDALFSALKPCSFQYNDGKSGRTHIGMIAQDVEEALSAAGLTSLDFAGFVKSPDEEAEGGYIYSLRYEEFVALCVREIQRLDQRVRELEL